MANINTLFPSKYLKAEDVKAGVTVTIAGMKMEKVAEGEADKPVIYFHGKQKGLVLNKTNAQMISHITGSFDTDEWANKMVYLHSEPVSFQGRIVDSIRVGTAPMAAPQPVPAGQQPMAPQSDSWAAENAAQAVQFENTAPFDDEIPF